jgi:hypothetical protein
LRKKPQSTELPLPVNNLPSSALPQASNLSNPNFDFEFQTPSIEDSSQNFPELPSIEVIVKLRSPTLKFVPKRIRSEWSRAWTETVQDCIYGNNISSYTFLFLLSKTCLRVPPSNIRCRRAKEDFALQLFKRWRGSVLTNGNTSKHEERISLWKELLSFSESLPKQKFSKEEINKKKRVLQMVADGRLSAACASLLSDALSEPNEEKIIGEAPCSRHSRKYSFSCWIGANKDSTKFGFENA